ncbi:MAG: hypothetical protein DI598_07390 [Pseudopedobacter saltans]|uniref:Uncharacterized protein n=1 Tax=Pseudopedobacter saltans TaxID=151895 RepID=A0A2W5GUS9_9SPHI|nr:MAG: hypothetical protein DI598_07390 [Pseudopedobacter saltans]
MTLRFLSKVAFICNLFFIVALILRYKQFSQQQDFNSHVILLGWLIAPLVNIIFTLWWFFGKKRTERDFPIAIGIANLIFLMVQIYLFFILR